MTDPSPESASDVPSGTVTFLFTDVEGSTSSWDSHAEGMDAALRVHDQVIRRIVTEHGGYVFATAGDSFSVAFSVAGSAVQAAVDIQRTLAVASWPEEMSLAVRMGLHTGHSVERDGDYFGPVVNRAARLMAVGHGGQIVCSSVTAQLARADTDDAVDFRSLGEFRLRDLLDPEQIVQVCTPDLPSAFPPLRTLEHSRHNLPLQRTRLIGRDEQVAQVAGLVRERRLVTLTGVGGCGKSRLALAVAAEVSADFADGTFLIELAPVADPERLVSTVAEVVGVRVESHQGGASRLAAVAAFVAGRELLLVLDNCEHLLDAVGEFVDEVMSSGGDARVLATSREALEVPGEQSHRVPSLAIGEGDGHGPAEELFLERMSERGGRQLGRDEWPVIVDICRHLDGLPLAIELAAAQSALMSPRELLTQLDRRFELLVGGRRRRRERHQTLQAVMEWSWDLLSDDERRLLAGLSVFTGGCTLEAAEGVCGELMHGSVALGLRALVSKSLVDPIETESVTRYRLLETVRLYSQQRLFEFRLSEAVRTAHSRWFVDWIEKVPFDERTLSFEWLRRMAADFDNLAAAVQWTTDREPATAARLVGSFLGLALAGVGATEILGWTTDLSDRQIDEVVRARMLVAGAFAAVTGGEHSRIVPWAAEAAELARSRDPFVTALASIWLAAPRMVPHPEIARPLMEAARAAAAISGSRLCQGFVECWSLALALCSGDESSIDVSPDDADRFGGRDSWGWTGVVQVGAVARAEQGRLEEALALASELRLPAQCLPVAQGYGVMLTAIAGRPDEARRLGATFIKEVDRSTDLTWHAELVLALGLCHLREGEPAVALAYFETAKRSPMFQPFWYALVRRYAARASQSLDEDAIAAARSHGRSLTVEGILQDELRTPG